MALAALRVFVWLWWRKAGGTVVCGGMERCQLVLSFLGTVAPSWSTLLLIELLPGPCQLLLQELFVFAGEISVRPAPCHGTGGACHSDGHAKGRRGLRGQQGCAGDSGDGSCPPVMPQGWLQCCELALCFLPEQRVRGRVRAGSGHQYRLLRSACLGWAGLGSFSSPGNTVGNKEPLFAEAELGWPPALSPRGWDAAQLGWRVLPWVLSTTVSPSLPCLWEEWDAL